MEKHASSKRQRQQQREAQRRATRLRRIGVAGVAILVLVLLGASTIYRSGTSSQSDNFIEAANANVDGPPDAPIRIVEYGDFGCPSCRAWHNSGIKEQLKAEFGDQISFTFRHFPVITAQSPKAAEAAQCAAEQNAFWLYHDYLYEQAPPGALGISELKSYAAAIGLDTAVFDSCLDSDNYQDYVARDLQAAWGAGAAGTPTFFINDRRVDFFSYEAMAGTIRQILDIGS
ncbi:MAG: DsbA family protein [Chloroflexi bacterium]|nr:DsbA family protein [Chloroflexota bacterium]MCI0643623.1 DsbA family protein [Chloroflexota bacterium]MCI0726841.1 DsbA family protein [Chloroflexota bacterium]